MPASFVCQGRDGKIWDRRGEEEREWKGGEGRGVNGRKEERGS